MDLGTKTLGLAISDRSNTLGKVLGVIRYNDYAELIIELKKVIAENEVGTLVLGLPKNMDNTLGFAAQRSLDFKEMLEKEIKLPVLLEDERLSTVEAENILLEADLSRKKRKSIIDGMAALIILESYLRRNSNGRK